jgi:peptidoglycan-N-acetylglucosamine deacetylase
MTRLARWLKRTASEARSALRWPQFTCREMNRLFGVLLLVGLSIAARRRASAPIELWAFTGPWDPRSDSSLRANAPHLDMAVTGWIGLDSNSAQPILPSPYPDTLRLGGTRVRRMAIVTSWHGDRFHPGSIRALGRDDARLAKAAGAIAGHAAQLHYAGLVLDFESLERTDRQSLLHVIKAIADSAHARHVSTIVVAIPAADTVVYPAKPLVAIADLVMPMLYDEHWSTSLPGAISEPVWVKSVLATRIAEVGASRIVAALPVYGYRWSLKTNAAAEDVTFAEAMRRAAQAGVQLTRDQKTNTLRGAKPGEWEIWVTDAELLAVLVRQTTDAGVHRIALWRIGQEDPAIWRALAR